MNFFEEELNEMVLLQNNKYILTNISDLNRDVDCNEFVKIFKFFNINNIPENQAKANEKHLESEENKQKKLRKREKIDAFLRDSAERTEVLINFLTMINKEKSIFSLKNLRDLKANEAEKKESEAINYLKKVDFFNKSIKFFSNRITTMRENKDLSQLIFRELLLFKKNGFLVEENYKFPDLIETISTKLVHKITLNFENLLGKTNVESKFSLNLLYDYPSNKGTEENIKNLNIKKFDLKYDFFDKFNKKHRLDFVLIIRFLGKSFVFNIGHILDQWVEAYFSNILDESIKKYDILNYLKFMFKYIWYRVFKIEIQNIIKLTKSNFYENKQFSYYINNNNTEFSINSSYLDILEVNLLIMKNKPNANLENMFKDGFEFKSISNNLLNPNKNVNLTSNSNIAAFNNSMVLGNQPNNEYLTASSSSFSNASKNVNLNQVNSSQNQQRNSIKQSQFSDLNNINNINNMNYFKNKLNISSSLTKQPYYNLNCNNNDDQTQSSVTSKGGENKIFDSEVKSKFEIPDKIIVNLVVNLFTELKSFKSIREFYYRFYLKNSENSNLPNFTNEKLNFNEFFDATIFNFNLNKFNQMLLKKFLVCRIDEVLNRRFITVSKISNFNYLAGNYLYRFNILNNLLNSKQRNMEFCIVFQKNKINIDGSVTKKNTILVSEKESNHELFNKRIDFNLLFEKLQKFLELNQES